MGAPRSTHPRKQVGFKFPPAFIAAYKLERERQGYKDDTAFVEAAIADKLPGWQALAAALGGSSTGPAAGGAEKRSPASPRASDPAEARAAAFRARRRP